MAGMGHPVLGCPVRNQELRLLEHRQANVRAGIWRGSVLGKQNTAQSRGVSRTTP